MTDKQIIIDGVDVSGCTHYRNYNDEFHCDLLSEPLVCVDNPNCYYKQHKRDEQRIVELNKTIKAKEQECERLKNERTVDLVKQLDQLKAENEELKKWLPITTRLVDEFENYEKIKGINYRIYTQVFFKKFNKLKQTLTEIKEIAERVKVYDPLAKQILQKISEVEDADKT